jgi:hypothetical protein
MGSGAVIYMPSLIKIGSGIQKLTGEGVHRHTGRRSHKSRKAGWKRKGCDITGIFCYLLP